MLKVETRNRQGTHGGKYRSCVRQRSICPSASESLTMFVTRALLATVFLMTVIVHSASAQASAMTNADVLRLVAMRVSDATVMSAVLEASTRAFDLSPQAVSNLAGAGVSPAVIATMRRSSAGQPTLIGVSVHAPVPGAQTLAGAQALAAARAAAAPSSVWGAQLPTAARIDNTPPADPSSPPVASLAPVPAAEVKGEDWWRSRALLLQRQRDADMRALFSARLHFASLPDQAKGILGVPVVEAWMKARAEIARLEGVVATDVQTVKDFEEEARKAGIIPGWLRVKQ